MVSLLEIQRGVRQGDPLSPYLFIIVLEVLAISIRENDDVTDIKLEIFADDLTVFLRSNRSLKYFLDVTLKFRYCAGLIVNFAKTEMLILGKTCMTPVRDQGSGKNIRSLFLL